MSCYTIFETSPQVAPLAARNSMPSFTSSLIVEEKDPEKFSFHQPSSITSLPPGLLRFAPPSHERSIVEQLNSLPTKDRQVVSNLKERWEERNPDIPFSGGMYLKFARCSVRSKPQRTMLWPFSTSKDNTHHDNIHQPFHEQDAWRSMTSFDHRYLSLTAGSLETQLRSKTLFPVPGLKSQQGHPIFYMRPSRYFPKSTPTQDVIDNLAYVMQSMTQTQEEAQCAGIGFLANMNGWKYENFSVRYCAAFMAMLQGQVPARVELFLIVDPPSWFPAIWKIMRPMLSASFRKKVHIIPQSKLHLHLEKDFETYLPDEMESGRAKTTEMVRDFIMYRQHLEDPAGAIAGTEDERDDQVPVTIMTT